LPVSVGRNDPCPCGSGKKYKKCCQAAIEEQARVAREEENRLITEAAEADLPDHFHCDACMAPFPADYHGTHCPSCNRNLAEVGAYDDMQGFGPHERHCVKCKEAIPDGVGKCLKCGTAAPPMRPVDREEDASEASDDLDAPAG
jgi:hypothetical protein